MSELITQNGHPISAENFMRLIKKVIPDGILDGCTVTKSGATINIAAGHIVAGGALVEVEATSLTVSASGELVLRIDKASDNPAQIVARAATGLTQQDLTNGGTIYEYRLATYTYSAGSVSLGGGNTSSSSSSPSSPSSSNSSSDSSSSVLNKSGTLTSKVSSTVSSPTVHYSAAYSATKSGTALSVTLNFAAWLGSSGSTLGTGIKLTIYARLNGGSWKSAVIKDNNASWKGTSQHSAKLNLTATTSGSSATVEFYVTRTGSNYSGTAGTLGSASAPKSYTINLS